MTSPTPDHWQIQDTIPAVDLAGILLGGPKLDGTAAAALDAVEAEREADFGRESDLEADR